MNAIVLSVALPLISAFLFPVAGRVSPAITRLAGPLVLLVSLAVVIYLWMQAPGAPVAIALGGFAPPQGISFYIDTLSLLFASLVLLTGLLLWPYGNDAGYREQGLWLLLAGAACGIVLSGDLFNIYVFFELVSVASFGLAATRRTGAAFVATTRYLVMSGFGTVIALTGIALIYTQTGTLNLAHLASVAETRLWNATGLAAFTLMLLGFGVKAELFPVNAWVPEVYATATTRVSALLAGIVSKLAVLVVVRLVVLLFPLPETLQLMLVLGLAGVLAGELAAWKSQDLTRMLAYSSIGQLGLVIIAFSIPGEAGMLAGLAVALHHLVVKPGLFLLAERWGGSMQRLDGAARNMPWAAGLFVLFALSLVGVPPLPGFWAKLLTIIGLIEVSDPLYLLAAGIVLVATIVEVNYLFRWIKALYRNDPESSEAHAAHRKLDLTISLSLGVVLLGLVVFMGTIADTMTAVATESTDRALYIQTVLSHSGGAR